VGGSTVLLVFGRGVVAAGDGYALTPGSRERVMAAVDHVVAARRRPARVVFTGGWAEATPAPPPGCREGDLMLAAARSAGLHRHADLYAETRSRSTLENLVHTVRDGLLDGFTFDPDRPLGLVTHVWHLPRVRFLAGKVLGLRGPALVDVPVAGAPARYERAVHLVARVCFVGPSRPEELIRRERVLVAVCRRRSAGNGGR
jgi:hypothetical protein